MGFFDWLFGRSKEETTEPAASETAAAAPSEATSESASELQSTIDGLSDGNITVLALKALDFVAPGDWNNYTDFPTMVKDVTGETDESFLADVRTKACELYADESNGYQAGLKIYQRVDVSDKALGTAALAAKVGEKIPLLNFLDKLTPKADTTQTVDVSIKVISELLAFTKINGMPGDSFSDFVKALTEYSGEAQMRMAALIAFDGLIPLGPDFVQKCSDHVGKLSADGLADHPLFKRVQNYIPGGQVLSQLDFVKEGFGAVTEWMDGFVKDKHLESEGILGKVRDFVEVSDDKLDYVAAFLDVTTNYYEHTGAQSVAKRIIERAVNEV